MKPFMTLAILLLAFTAGGCSKKEPPGAQPETDGTETVTADTAEHGTFPEIPPGAAICPVHRVPEIVCPFCNPQFVANAGHCGGHDVPEGLCTRCHPILIAAFKAEGDWCDEHDLPESQCLVCNPRSGG